MDKEIIYGEATVSNLPIDGDFLPENKIGPEHLLSFDYRKASIDYIEKNNIEVNSEEYEIIQNKVRAMDCVIADLIAYSRISKENRQLRAIKDMILKNKIDVIVEKILSGEIDERAKLLSEIKRRICLEVDKTDNIRISEGILKNENGYIIFKLQNGEKRFVKLDIPQLKRFCSDFIKNTIKLGKTEKLWNEMQGSSYNGENEANMLNKFLNDDLKVDYENKKESKLFIQASRARRGLIAFRKNLDKKEELENNIKNIENILAILINTKLEMKSPKFKDLVIDKLQKCLQKQERKLARHRKKAKRIMRRLWGQRIALPQYT